MLQASLTKTLNFIMQKILTRPSWQIFLLWMLPVLFPSSLFGLILTITWMALMSYCIYFLCDNLYQKLPAGHDLNFKRFQFNFFFVVLYLSFVFIVFEGGYEINQDNYKDFGWTIFIILPLHIYMMYCLFYIIWFIAKSITTIENNNVVAFEKYASNFFLLWFFPFGIFWVHPKVRKIFSVDTESQPTT
jgi:hypothetical protein